MANNDIEIEIKYQLTKAQFKAIRQRLEQIAEYKGASNHKDTYYSPGDTDFLKPKYPYEWLSIRERNEKIILNYKHWYPENTERTTHCDELEVDLSTAKKMDKVLKALKIAPFITVEKKRLIYEYKDELEAVLDEVADLGYFIEIETITEFPSIEAANKRLAEFASEIGADQGKEELRGYPFMLMRSKGLI